MKAEEHDALCRAEDGLWWCGGMEAITRRVLDRTYRRGGDLVILDAGCGSGGAMRYLAGYGRVVGLDMSMHALTLCQGRGIQTIARGSISEMPVVDACADLVTSFDVVSDFGVSDDVATLREFARVLRPGGRLLLRLPAFNWLYGRHDRAVNTRRRYTATEVRARLREAGFQVEWWSYANTFLFPLAVLARLRDRMLRAEGRDSDISVEYGAANGALRWILSAEAPLVARVGLPVGLTVVAVGRKPPGDDRQ
jgi:SAM-dependent methyltransferase